MNKNIFHFLFLLALALPFQAKAFPVDGILGNWTTQQPLPGRNVEFYLSFSFEQNRVITEVECRFYDGQVLSTRAMAEAAYDGNDIFILERNQGTVSDGIHFCQASLDRSRWSAYFDGMGKLVLFVPVPYQTRFILVRIPDHP